MSGFGTSSARDLTIDVRDLIRDYIRSYPTGVAIIKEFIQNADDAQATELGVILDRRTHPDGLLRDPRMRRLLGPALLFTNNALFTEPDHTGITTLLNSGKRKESGKIGRFGIGFNCCYNITDFPSYASGTDIVCLDPCYAAVRSEGEPRTIREPLAGLWATDSAWLRTFECVGLSSGCPQLPGTVFRLPLRMSGFQAPEPITPKTLSFADFDAIVSDLRALGPQLLLFTKHLLTLRIGSIGESKAEPHWLLTITSTNAEKVIQARRPIVDQLKGEPKDVVNNLRSNPKTPLIRYVHEFQVLDDNISRKESWVVLGGLFRGKDDRLIQHCDEMLNLNEKAIPLAGCAARLSSESAIEKLEAVAGRMYCGLPIKRETPLAFHINAYFDTDSSRTDITGGTDLKGDDVKRATWNLLLMEDAVAPCAADLIKTLVAIRPNTDPDALYRVFPKASVQEPFNRFVEGFYRTLIDASVIRAESLGGEKWVSIAESWLVPLKLLDPMVAEGLVVAVPELPTHVKLGFSSSGVALNELNRDTLKKRLSSDKDIDCEISAAPRASLRRREWIEDLLAYCYAEDNPDQLSGLPLALLADGRLHTFGKSRRGFVFSATESQRELFPDNLDWFLDPKLKETVGIKPKQNSVVRTMSLKDVVEGLATIVPSKTDSDPTSWKPIGPELPNEKWLTKVFTYFAKLNRAEWADFKIQTSLHSLSLIPDQFNRLHRGGLLGAPLLRLMDPSKAAVTEALSELGIPLVTGAKEICEAIASFSAIHADYVRELNANFSALSLKSHGTKTIAFESRVHDVVIDFFSHAFAGGDLSDQAVTSLVGLQIIPTSSQQLVSAAEQDVYLPPSFDLKVNFRAKLVRRGERDIRVPLLTKLGVHELTLHTLISRYVVSSYRALNDPQKVELLAWIREVYYEQERRLGSTASDTREVIALLEACEFIKCSDGVYRAPKSIYAPTAKLAQEVLGAAAPIPCLKTYERFSEAWADFLTKCGMESLPRASDLFEFIVKTTKLPESADRSKALMRASKCIADNLDHFSSKPLPDGRSFFGALKSTAWLPALRDSRQLESPAFAIPRSGLFRPNEIYAREMLALVGNVHPVLVDQMDHKFRDALGMPKVPSVEDVCRQLDYLIQRVEKAPPTDKTIRHVVSMFESVYQFLGKDPNATNIARNDLSQRFAGKKCVLDKAGKLWPAKKVFAAPIPFFGERRLHYAPSDSSIAGGLDRLGRQCKPILQDFLDYLVEVAHEYKKSVISETDAARVLEIYGLLSQNGKPESLPRTLPFLSQSLQLIPASELLREDTSRYRGKLDSTIVNFVDTRIPIPVCEAAGILDLSKCCKEVLVTMKRFEGEVIVGVESLLGHVRSPVVVGALQRLALKYLSVQLDTGIIDRLRTLRVEMCSEITTKILVLRNGRAFEAGVAATEWFYDVTQNKLLLTIGTSHDWQPHFAKAIANILDPSQKLEASSVILLFTQPVSGINKILDVLDAPPLPEPPIARVEPTVSAGAQAGPPQSDLASLQGPEERAGETDWAAAEERGDAAASEEEEQFQPAEPGSQRATPEELTDDKSVPSPSHSGQIANRGEGGGPVRTDDLALGKPIRFENAEQTVSQMDQGPHHRGERPGPPREPTPVSGSNPYSGRRGQQVVTYVDPDRSERSIGGSETNDELHRDRIDIGKAAVDAVLASEAKRSRVPTEMPHLNPGFDVVSTTDPKTGEQRYIEVKGTDGEWDAMGVAVTKPQIELARSVRDQFWLYVVEWARSGQPKIHRIRDPYTRINQFRFDGGWKALAEEEDSSATDEIAPEAITVGSNVTFTHNGTETCGIVEAIKGKLRILVIRTDDGAVVEKLLSPAIRLSQKESGDGQNDSGD